jgi:2-polyprenyl-3-methyl-5-hydroxy-6-metoxy-1,4-benzoquinol methylase
VGKFPQRDCAACGASEPVHVFTQRFAAIEGASIIDGYDVVTCAKCGFAYADGIPDQRAYDDYYERMSKYEYHQRDGAESPYDTKRMGDIADEIAPLLSDGNRRILDIGCATGRLLFLLKSRGFSNVRGLDPSLGCLEAARRLYGIDVLQGSISKVPADAGPFDVVILIGVLEHIRDLDAAMKRIESLLTPEGLVYAEVPNVVDFEKWPNAPFQDFSTEHINFFGPVSLTNLFARFGLAPVYQREHAREQSYRTTMSCLSAAYRRTAEPQELRVDHTSRPALKRYIQKSVSEEARIRSKVDGLVQSKAALFVWGVGTNTTRLLATTRLGQANIQAFVDSNTKFHGKRLHGRPIISPTELLKLEGPILIVSRVFQSEISQQIRELLGTDREILTLYKVE